MEHFSLLDNYNTNPNHDETSHHRDLHLRKTYSIRTKGMSPIKGKLRTLSVSQIDTSSTIRLVGNMATCEVEAYSSQESVSRNSACVALRLGGKFHAAELLSQKYHIVISYQLRDTRAITGDVASILHMMLVSPEVV